MSTTRVARPHRREWLGLAVLAVLSLVIAWAAMTLEPPPIEAAGPPVAVPEATPPTPLPDVQPEGNP